MTGEDKALRLKLKAMGDALAGWGQSDFAMAAAGEDGENLLNALTGLCFNAPDAIDRAREEGRLAALDEAAGVPGLVANRVASMFPNHNLIREAIEALKDQK